MDEHVNDVPGTESFGLPWPSIFTILGTSSHFHWPPDLFFSVTAGSLLCLYPSYQNAQISHYVCWKRFFHFSWEKMKALFCDVICLCYQRCFLLVWAFPKVFSMITNQNGLFSVAFNMILTTLSTQKAVLTLRSCFHKLGAAIFGLAEFM